MYGLPIAKTHFIFVRPLTQSTLPEVVAQAVSALSLVLLAASGVFKVLDPDPTKGALAAARLPSSRFVARCLGLFEGIAAVVGLAVGGRWLAFAALLYLGFSVFTVVAVSRRLPIQSCGCFGREDTPPTVLHVIFNGFAATALWYLVAVNGLAAPWSGSNTELALFLVFAVLGAYLAYLLLSQLPRTLQMTSSQ
ncbi:MAG TPA: MauE/DoxX family redox-associated membrane protein [Acidimicrobiia bacterium]|nr:MauE/DoxX family redox-associated membrane protein [Acidimicrobiia bacterium]